MIRDPQYLTMYLTSGLSLTVSLIPTPNTQSGDCVIHVHTVSMSLQMLSETECGHGMINS